MVDDVPSFEDSLLLDKGNIPRQGGAEATEGGSPATDEDPGASKEVLVRGGSVNDTDGEG